MIIITATIKNTVQQVKHLRYNRTCCGVKIEKLLKSFYLVCFVYANLCVT